MLNKREFGRGGEAHRERPQQPSPPVSDEDLKEIVNGGDAIKLNEVSNGLGRYYAQGLEKERLSTSQIRSILDHLQRMHQFNFNDLQLLRPKLAYAAGRHGGKLRHLQEITDKAILLVGKDSEHFQNFRNFFEAIVAYHRYHEESRRPR
jgi:CRISPR-associated protein Csm2